MIDYQETIERLEIEIFEANEARVDLPWLEDAITLLKHYREGLETIKNNDYPNPSAAWLGDYAEKILEGPE